MCMRGQKIHALINMTRVSFHHSAHAYSRKCSHEWTDIVLAHVCDLTLIY